MLGSEALSERARELEAAAKDGNISLISEKHGGLMNDTMSLADSIGEICGVSGSSEDTDEVMEFMPENASGDDEVIEFEPYREER